MPAALFPLTLVVSGNKTMIDQIIIIVVSTLIVAKYSGIGYLAINHFDTYKKIIYYIYGIGFCISLYISAYCTGYNNAINTTLKNTSNTYLLISIYSGLYFIFFIAYCYSMFIIGDKIKKTKNQKIQ